MVSTTPSGAFDSFREIAKEGRHFLLACLPALHPSSVDLLHALTRAFSFRATGCSPTARGADLAQGTTDCGPQDRMAGMDARPSPGGEADRGEGRMPEGRRSWTCTPQRRTYPQKRSANYR